MRHSLSIGLGITLIAACGTAASAELIFGTTQQGFLISFDSSNPSQINSALPVQGLMSNEHIVGMDFRATDFNLYAYTNFGRTYTVDQVTAQATFRGQVMPFDGSNFGFDWNPIADEFRVLTESDYNARISLDGNTVTSDSALTYAMADTGFGVSPNIIGSSYTNSIADATSTQLFAIDSGTNNLVRLDDPASGLLSTVGSLGIDINARGGFDISGVTGIAYLGTMLTSESSSRLYTVNLETGATTQIGVIDGGLELRTMTVVQPIPAPGALAMLGLGCAVLGIRRRRA